MISEKILQESPSKVYQGPLNPQTPLKNRRAYRKHDHQSTKDKTVMRKFRKSVWTAEEDEILKLKVEEKGPSHWAVIASFLPNRSGKQCRERWHNHLREGVSKKNWQMEQYWMLALCVRAFGRKWSAISQYIPGRSDNTIKNQWNCKMKPYREHFQKRIDRVILSPESWTTYGEDEKSLLKMIYDKKMNEKTTQFGTIKNMINSYNKLFTKGLQEFHAFKKTIDIQTVPELQVINYQEEVPGELSAAISAQDSLFLESHEEDPIIPM